MNDVDACQLLVLHNNLQRTQEALVFFTLPVEVDADGDIEQFESGGGAVYRFK